MGYIYKISNDINDKVYIGKTTFNIEKRWNEHCNDSTKVRCKNKPLYQAFNKYGIAHFKIEAIEECDDEKLNERESYWIEYYDSYCYGYNATLGGDGTIRIDRNIVYQLWEEGLRPKEIAQKINKAGDINRISDILYNKYGKETVHQEVMKRYNSVHFISVACFDKINEELVHTFDNLKNAAEWLKDNGYAKSDISTISSNVGKASKGTKPSAYGFKWKRL